MRIWHGLLTACWILAAPGIEAAKTQARLLLAAEAAQPGETFLAAIELKMAPRWHTYWRYPGDSGAPAKISWNLPRGVTAGEILWPIPQKYESGGLTTYVYHDTILLLVPLALTNGVMPGKADISAQVWWLECEELCVPGEADVRASVVVGAVSKASPDFGLIEEWKRKLPQDSAPFPVEAQWVTAAGGTERQITIAWPRRTGVAKGDFYPYGSDRFEINNATENLPGDRSKIQLRKDAQKLQSDWPEKIEGLLVELDEQNNALSGYSVPLALAPAGKAAASAAAETTGAAQIPGGNGVGETKSLWAMLLLAFLGGLVLNVMPCVLPVLALKVLGFVNQSKEEPARVRQLGLVYAAGVLSSFVVLAGLVIGVQKAGKLASWGMQFQNPQFLVLMTALVTLVALNLFGVFEVNLGGSVMGAASQLAYREGKSGAFFNGVLATALATPCTAPFLGIALGFAFTQSPAVILLMFVMIGLGLAVPYVLLSWWPALLKFLPKPGPWMEKFKIAMGFPMLATAVWLFSILTRHYGQSGVLWVGLFLVILGLSAWIWGAFVQQGSRRKGLALLATLLFLGAGYLYALEKKLHWRTPPKNVQGQLVNDADGIQWKPWSPAAVNEARQAGRPAFVDFTADWCATCQANKATSIDIPAVRAKLKEINAVALIGDYTLEDDAITEELLKFGRAGVPLVLVYPKDPKRVPNVLPAVLTPKIVLSALDEAAK